VTRTRVLAAALAAAVACGRSDAPADAVDDAAYANVLPFDTAQLRIATATDTARLTVQVAATEAQRTLGLMERRTLGEDAGMLFVYPETQPDSGAFWMFRTRIPLDIAFIDSTGTIRAIRGMEPCESPVAQGCPTYPAGVPYRAALEVNRGYFERRGVRVGDRLPLADLPAAPGSS
jgi:uncharacterized membrane protein (UPF0127 family)